MYVYALMPFLVCYVVLVALELEAAQILLCYIPYMICSQKKVSDRCSFQEDGSSAGNIKEWWKLSRVRRCTITICSVIHTFRDLLQFERTLCAHLCTIHAYIHGYAHTCNVHAIDLMDAIFSQRTESHKNAIAGYSWP